MHTATQGPGHHLRDGGQQLREPGAAVADPHRCDRLAGRIGDLHLMAVAVGRLSR
jgi:hypothetical protein